MAHGVIAAIDSMVAERSLLKHPFYQAWTAGTLPLERLQSYAIRYYPHVAAFPRYLSAIHSRCADIEARQAILENLIEEERGGENHPELWLRFAESLGIARERVLEAEPCPAAQNLVGMFTELAASGGIQRGLAALYAYESQIPAVAAAKIDGLRRFYGIGGERGLKFFSVHERADVWHARADAGLIERYSRGAAEADAAVAAAGQALDALWGMLDAV
ncbi:MAG: CADD family putative folate metabolism protein [Candidatus Binataceae bacterium]